MNFRRSLLFFSMMFPFSAVASPVFCLGVDAMAPYGTRASYGAGVSQGGAQGQSVGLGIEAALDVLFKAAGIGMGLGVGFLGHQNFTSSLGDGVRSDEGNVRNLSISPRMASLRLRLEYGPMFLVGRGHLGTGQARVVEDAVGYDYALTNGSGFGAGLGAVTPVGGFFRARVSLFLDSVTFKEGRLTRVSTDTPPHSAPWKWSGASLGLGAEVPLF
jgi:hypothetical protein